MPDDNQVFTAPPDPRATAISTYATELAKSGISKVTAAEFAEKTFSSVQTAAYLASHAHQDQPNLPRNQWQATDAKAFKSLLSERLFDQAFQDSVVDPASANAVIISSPQYNYDELYNQVRQVPFSPSLDQPDPLFHYIAQTGSAQFKDAAGKIALKKFFSSEAGQKVAKTLGTEATKKLLTQLGVKLGAQAATAGGGAAAGAEAGAAAGSPGGPLAIVTAIVGAVVGFVLGAVVGNWSKVKKEAEEGILALSAGIYTVGSSIFSGGVAAVGAIFAAIGTVAVESAGTIVVIVLAVPIVLAFFIYIINNSAYIVPPSSTVFVPGGPGGGGFENRSSCPLTDGYIGTFSYNSTSETGHGSNPYWNVPNAACNTTNACFLNIPANGNSKGPIGSSAAANCCYQLFNCSNPSSPGCTIFYGYAIDVYSRAGSAAYNKVYFPLINGKITTWNYANEIGMPPNRGKAYLYTTTDPDTGTRYDVVFMHLVALSSPPTGLQSGQVLGQVYPATIFRPHVHLELQVDGVYVKPENYFCGGGSAPPASPSTAYIARGSISSTNVVSSKSTELTPTLTCSWSSPKSLAAAINANYFKADSTPVGYAGYGANDVRDYGCGTACATKTFIINSSGQGSIISSSSVSNPNSLLAAVSGRELEYNPGTTNRTGLGISSGNLILFTVPNSTSDQFVAFAASLGLNNSNALQLDGGGSTTFCSGSTPSLGNSRLVPVSIGLKNATITTQPFP